MSIDDERRALEAEIAYWEKVFTFMSLSDAIAMCDDALRRLRGEQERKLERIEQQFAHLSVEDRAALKQELNDAYGPTIARIEQRRADLSNR